MEKLFEVLRGGILGVFRAKGKISIRSIGLNGIGKFFVVGEECAPAIVEVRDSASRDGVIGEYCKARCMQRSMQRLTGIVCFVVYGLDEHYISPHAKPTFAARR